MKLQYLGTAAAEGWPGLFCDCDACRRAAAAGGRNIRSRSQAVIDDRLLIDFPPDTLHHVYAHGLKLHGIRTCLLTHSHSDHLYAADLEMRRAGFAYFEDERPFTLYGGRASGELVRPVLAEHDLTGTDRMRFCPIEAFSAFDAEGYTVTPLAADHAAHTSPVIFHITDGGKALLYANDTGWFPAATWEWMAEHKPRYDFVSLDCTGGKLGYRQGHMGFSACVEAMAEMRRIGCADDRTAFCLHHFSHNGEWIYDELAPIAAEKGMLVSYDGMIVHI